MSSSLLLHRRQAGGRAGNGAPGGLASYEFQRRAEPCRAVQSAEVGVLLVPLIMETPMQDAMVVESSGPSLTCSQRLIPRCHEMLCTEALFCRSLPFSLSVPASAPLNMLHFADAVLPLDFCTNAEAEIEHDAWPSLLLFVLQCSPGAADLGRA